MVKKKSKNRGYIAVNEEDKRKYIKQKFKGEVIDKEIKFPKSIGAEHPFNFEDTEKLYKKYGLVSSIVNKYASMVVGDFTVQLKNPNAKKIINEFLHSTNFLTVMDSWVREAILKGNGFIEIDLKEEKIRVLNANYIYIKRNKKGKVLRYNQWMKKINQFKKGHKDLIDFKPHKIAHLPINKIPNDPYGIGMIWQNERIIENLINGEQDSSKIIKRKAGSPYHFKVGQPGKNTPPNVVNEVKSNLTYLNTQTEWVTDGDVEIKSIDFKDLGKSLNENLMYNFRQLLAGTEIPEVLMGSGQLNEGIAKTQMQGLKAKIKSIQRKVESIVEEQIIRPILRENNLDEQPSFVWELATEEDKNEKIDRIAKLLSGTVQLSAGTKAALEIELAKLMDNEELLKVLKKPMDAQKEEDEQKKLEDQERKQEEEIPQPEVPGAKPTAEKGKVKLKEKKDSNNLTIKEWTNIKEIPGISYSDYIIQAILAVENDPFSNLLALNEAQIAEGLLTEQEVLKLRQILKDGFRENKTIIQIEDEINQNIQLRDRLREGKVVLGKQFRANNIARTETVRLSSMGLLDLYKQNKIREVRFLASISDRTCPQCENLNSQIFSINESVGIIPVHSNCRCSWVGVK